MVNTTKAEAVLAAARKKDLRLLVAESCTGGLLAAAFTSIPGASDVFWGGFVSYANEAKRELLGVDLVRIDKFGAVSEQVAREMAYGPALRYDCQLTAAISGIAGPDGGSDDKPVGTVHIATYCKGEIAHQQFLFDGDREAVRQQSVDAALEMLLKAVG